MIQQNINKLANTYKYIVEKEIVKQCSRRDTKESRRNDQVKY